jgi:hypothetical protein
MNAINAPSALDKTRKLQAFLIMACLKIPLHIQVATDPRVKSGMSSAYFIFRFDINHNFSFRFQICRITIHAMNDKIFYSRLNAVVGPRKD